MALTPDGPDAVVDPGIGPDDEAPATTDQPGESTASLVAASASDVMAPIVVPNTLWTSASPGAYASTAPAFTHLRELAHDELANADTARWGQLEVIPTKADLLVDLIRMNSLWPLLSGLACCAIEMMSAATSKNDMDRWGMFPFRASPRQADVLIVAGTLTTKMAGPLVRLWEQMPEPKWCVAMGDCTCSGGRYKRSYSTIEGIDRLMPVDVYVPGCPPRPEGLIYGMMKLGQLVKERRGHWPDRPIAPNVPEDV
jgi:NADH-quinone oxidoreductase subunit B